MCGDTTMCINVHHALFYPDKKMPAARMFVFVFFIITFVFYSNFVYKDSGYELFDCILINITKDKCYDVMVNQT